MKRKLTLALALLLIVSLLAGCGASNDAASDSATSAPSANNSSSSGGNTAGDFGYDYGAGDVSMEESEDSRGDNAQTGSESGNADAPGSSTLPENAKMIYTATLELETTEFDATVSSLEGLVTSMGGYYENSSVDNYSNYRHGYYTVRIPAENYAAFCERVGTLCQLNHKSSTADNVSEFYYDTEARLVTQRTKLDRLQDLLSRAETMEDIITIESAIAETELEIEYLTGTLRHYDSLIGYSTVHIYLNEVYKLTDIQEPAIGFGAKLAQAFRDGVSTFNNRLQRFLLSVASNWIGWLIFLIIAAVIVWVAIRVARRGRSARAERRSGRRGLFRTAKDKSTGGDGDGVE